MSLSNASSSRDDLRDVHIAVMGVTGAGKSTFVEACTGQTATIGHSLESCTAEVKEYAFVYKDAYHVRLYDTPGLSDTTLSNAEIVREIVSCFGNPNTDGVRLDAILFLHPVAGTRMDDSNKTCLNLFKKMCGRPFYPNIVCAMSFCEMPSEAELKKRESDLIKCSNYWGDLIQGGSRAYRLYHTVESALDILDRLLECKGGFLDIQLEMTTGGLSLDKTSAGQAITSKFGDQKQRALSRINKLEARKRHASSQNEMDNWENDVSANTDKLQTARAGETNIKVDFANLQYQKEAEFVKMMEELQALKEKLESMRSDPHVQAEDIRVQEAKVQNAEASVASRSRRFAKRARVWFGERVKWLEANPDHAARIGVFLVEVGGKVFSALSKAK